MNTGLQKSIIRVIHVIRGLFLQTALTSRDSVEGDSGRNKRATADTFNFFRQLTKPFLRMSGEIDEGMGRKILQRVSVFSAGEFSVSLERLL